MGTQPENQQYKKPQAPPSMPETKDDDFRKQGVDKGRKDMPGTKGKENKTGVDADADADSQ